MAKTAKKTLAKKASAIVTAKKPKRVSMTVAPKATKATPAPRLTAAYQAIYDAALKGRLPPAPDFTAATHKPYRTKLATLVDLAKKRDVKGLAAVAINPISTSPKALARYRDWSILAIKAKASAAA